MADSSPVKPGVVERQCSRCCQIVSFSDPEPGTPLFCPICKEPIHAVGDNAAPLPSESNPEAATWWLSGSPAPSSAARAVKAALKRGHRARATSDPAERTSE